MRANLHKILSSLFSWFDFQDVVFIAAAGAVGYGVWQYSPAAAFITIGSLFLVLTTFGRFK